MNKASKRPTLVQTVHFVLADAARQAVFTVAMVAAGIRQLLAVRTSAAQVRRPMLIVARAAWLAVAALTLGLYLAGLRQWLAQPYWFNTIPCPGALCVPDPPAVERALAPLHLTLSLVGGYLVAMHLLVVAGYVGIGSLIFWRRSHDPLALFVSLTLLVFGASFFDPEMGLLPAANPTWWLPIAILRFLGIAAFGTFVVVFPDGRFVPRGAILVAAAWILLFLPFYLIPGSPLDFQSWPPLASLGSLALVLGSILAVQVYRYRHGSRPAQRQQTKWVVLGMGFTALAYFGRRLVLVSGAAATQMPPPTAVLWDFIARTLLYVSLLLIPLSIGLAMLRYHLFDVDRLIRRTLVYGSLTAILAAIYVAGVVGSQAIVSGRTQASSDEQSPLLVVITTLVIAALFHPLRRRLQTLINKRFYRRKYDATRTLARFGEAVRSEVELGPLTDHLMTAVDETVQPAHASLWLRPPPPQQQQ